MSELRNDNDDCCTTTSINTPQSDVASHLSATSCCTVAAGPKVDGPPSETSTMRLLDRVRSEDVSEDVDALRAAGFSLLLETGRPVAVEDLVSATGIAPERVDEILESAMVRGRIEIDDQGRLVGVAGLSLTPGRHELDIAGERRWIWCALDAVGIAGALGVTGSARSIDPHTGDPITIDFVDGHPVGDPFVVIPGSDDVSNVRRQWCPTVNFFATRSAAEAWVTDRGLVGDIVSVHRVAEEAAAMWRRLTEHALFRSGREHF